MEDARAGTGARWEKLQRELGQRLSQRLFDELAADPGALGARTRRPPSWSLGLAYAAAALVYFLSLAFGLLGAWLLWQPFTTIFDPLVGVALLLFCWAARPRASQPPYRLLRRAEFPTLYALADRMAQALGTRPVEAIGYSARFTANYRQAGWRNQPYIEIGAPLMAVLDHEERLAVLAHELAHGANGDPLRGNFLHGAVDTLATWSTAVRPVAIGALGKGLPWSPFISLLGIPVDLFMLALSELLFLLAKGVYLLVLRQSQRAEYLADRLAASVAGSQQMRGALEKTYLEDVVQGAVRAHALVAPYKPIGDKLVQAAGSVAESELAALRATSLSSQWQVDATHPPTALRVEMLARAPGLAMQGLWTPEERAALDLEIERIVKFAERELVDFQLEAMA